MNKDQLYPQSVEKLFEKIDYIISNEQNQEKIINLTNWLEWFKSLNYDFRYVCDENEFLKPFYDENKFALQIWKHEKEVDSIEFNLISNYYSEYDNELTQLVV